MKIKEKSSEIIIDKFKVGQCTIPIVGDSPLIYNAMSAKAKHELLFPRKKTKADREQNMKHDPISEFQNSMYRRKKDGPTRLIFPASAFKAAICNAALEIPGATKAQMGRLIWVVGNSVDVYGIPKLLMSVVRSSGIDRTPDIRTRAILPQWCCQVKVQFVANTLNETNVVKLFATAGIVIGIGDFRQEKGKGNSGQFHIAPLDDLLDIMKKGGQKEQDQAMANPDCYDIESRELLTWFEEEKTRRGK